MNDTAGATPDDLYREISRIEGLLDRALARLRPVAQADDGIVEADPDRPERRVNPDGLVELVLADLLPPRPGGPRGPIARLRAAFDLDELATWLLLMAVAPTLSHRVAHGYAYLRHDPDQPFLSLGVALDLLGIDGLPGSGRLFAPLSRTSPLVDLELLLVPPGGVASMRDSIRPSPRIIDFLLGGAGVPEELRVAAELDPARRPEPLVLGEGQAEQLATLEARVHAQGGEAAPHLAPVLVVVGPAGAGKALCAAHMAHRVGRRLLRVDVRRLPNVEAAAPQPAAPADPLAAVRRAIREARLQGAMLCLEGLHAWSVEHDRQLGQLLERRMDVYALSSESSLAGRELLPRGRPTFQLTLERPPASHRLTLWQRHLPRHLRAAPRAVELAAQRYRLTGGQIRRAAGAVADLAQARALVEIDPALIDDAVRQVVTHSLTTLAREIRPAESMDDLVVPEETRMLLAVLAANHRHRRQVFQDWGFGRRFDKGLGITALFSGPPGTGKSMAAGAVATELGLPLFQIELGQVVSKWVGETEKNLDQIFQQAEAASAVILFDEADSLFSRRTEVTSANDRYANLEVNHLLQRVEAFEGVVILTTNNLAALDQAFLRRFAYRLHFPLPDVAERAQLWQRLIPREAAVVHPIDYQALAKAFEFSGGHIKNAVLRAAFFAADLGRPIDETLLRLTANLELKQLGGVVRSAELVGTWKALRAGPS